MPDLPITGDPLYDFLFAGALVVAGVALALKAEQSWGWLLVVLAGIWAFMLTRVLGY